MTGDAVCQCEEFLSNLYEYQHRELSDEECQRVGEHLKVCPDCRDLYVEEETIRRKLSACACEQAPMELRMRVTTFIASIRYRS